MAATMRDILDYNSNSAHEDMSYDGSMDDTTDMAWRGGYAVERIARRNARSTTTLAECGHCGDIFDAATDGAQHVAACTGTRRRRDHSKYAAWRTAR